MDEEVRRLDGKGLLELELIGGVVQDEVELLQEFRESDDGFLPGERPADAGAYAKAERLP